MDSEGEFFSKPYINDTKKTNLYSFSAYQIDKPGSHEQGRAIHDGEIIFTVIENQKNSDDYFQINFTVPYADISGGCLNFTYLHLFPNGQNKYIR